MFSFGSSSPAAAPRAHAAAEPDVTPSHADVVNAAASSVNTNSQASTVKSPDNTNNNAAPNAGGGGAAAMTPSSSLFRTGSFSGMSSSAASNAGNATTNNSQPSGISLECDYDKRPTPMYKYIQSKQWDRVLQMFEHPEHAVQASVWVVRKEPSGQLRWRLLPLHAALIFQAPLSVIEGLLSVDPSAAAAKDDQGMLPLHLALRNRPIQWTIVEELLTVHPAAVFVQDRKGRTPLQGAASLQNQAKLQQQAAVNASDLTFDDVVSTNKAALSVLQLYTQIAVAGERKRREPADDASTSSTVAALSQQHANKLAELQQELEEERQQWKNKTLKLQTELRQKTTEAAEREGNLLKAMDRLQSKALEWKRMAIAEGGEGQEMAAVTHTLTSHDDDDDDELFLHPSLMGRPPAAQPDIKRRAREVDPNEDVEMEIENENHVPILTTSSRILQLEEENQSLKCSVEELLEQHDTLKDLFQAMVSEQQDRFQQEQRQQLLAMQEQLDLAHANRQAHCQRWHVQLQSMEHGVRQRLLQVGLTDCPSTSSGDEDDPQETEAPSEEASPRKSTKSPQILKRIPKAQTTIRPSPVPVVAEPEPVQLPKVTVNVKRGPAASVFTQQQVAAAATASPKTANAADVVSFHEDPNGNVTVRDKIESVPSTGAVMSTTMGTVVVEPSDVDAMVQHEEDDGTVLTVDKVSATASRESSDYNTQVLVRVPKQGDHEETSAGFELVDEKKEEDSVDLSAMGAIDADAVAAAVAADLASHEAAKQTLPVAGAVAPLSTTSITTTKQQQMAQLSAAGASDGTGSLLRHAKIHNNKLAAAAAQAIKSKADPSGMSVTSSVATAKITKPRATKPDAAAAKSSSSTTSKATGSVSSKKKSKTKLKKEKLVMEPAASSESAKVTVPKPPAIDTEPETTTESLLKMAAEAKTIVKRVGRDPSPSPTSKITGAAPSGRKAKTKYPSSPSKLRVVKGSSKKDSPTSLTKSPIKTDAPPAISSTASPTKKVTAVTPVEADKPSVNPTSQSKLVQANEMFFPTSPTTAFESRQHGTKGDKCETLSLPNISSPPPDAEKKKSSSSSTNSGKVKRTATTTTATAAANPAEEETRDEQQPKKPEEQAVDRSSEEETEVMQVNSEEIMVMNEAVSPTSSKATTSASAPVAMTINTDRPDPSESIARTGATPPPMLNA